ncbi:Ferric-chelate reductase 1 [Strongyloides ratti]|uniref:ascorbate ferrireductase (transmembrane) n=1 Tax=Strongyloides ratti TaxID=34506 RepID=A0A090KQB6_STRRB|nr:Ferric-chelate reductase 1 [Strongyloides ratti]CEF59688.1 Ferric-chelate reductase 1 [Strongyloides ratti]
MTLIWTVYRNIYLLLITTTIILSLPNKYNKSNIYSIKRYELDPDLKSTLTNVHGVCFIIGWFFFILNGVFYIRYYKSFFESKNILNQKIWFQVHRIFNTLALLITTIGMLCILIRHNFEWIGPKIGGKQNTSSGAVHAMMGVFSYGLLVLQVLISFLRCAPNHNNRKYFNWIHRFLGISSFLLATGTITIAAKFFGSHFTSPKNAEIMLYVFYGVILITIIVNEISLKFVLKKQMTITLITLFFTSLIVCSYISALILTSKREQ